MKPILFSTPMIQAILNGRKTMTRRIVKRSGYDDHINCPENNFAQHQHNNLWHIGVKGIHIGPDNATGVIAKYQVGDILWVRETWSPVYVTPKRFLYKADVEFGGEGAGLPVRWRPSIHMPREAARIFLRVTGVKVERLQDITEADAECEGCKCDRDGVDYRKFYYNSASIPVNTSRAKFYALWNKLNSKSDYGWDANPWVWVISFERATIGGEGAST